MQSDDDLLGPSRPMAQFADARPSPRSASRKAPSRGPAAAPAKRATTNDVWCCMVLSFLTLGGYGYYAIPSHDRNLMHFESKLRTIERAVGGDLERENGELTATLHRERQEEAALQQGEERLKRQLAQARGDELTLQKQLSMKESSYESAEKDIIKTRKDLQSWHKKSDGLESQLGAAQRQADQQSRELGAAQRENSQVLQRSRDLQNSLAAARRQVAGLQASERRLRGQLEHEERWHADTMNKLHHFKDAEDSLMQSMGVTSH